MGARALPVRAPCQEAVEPRQVPEIMNRHTALLPLLALTFITGLAIATLWLGAKSESVPPVERTAKPKVDIDEKRLSAVVRP